MSSCYAQLGLAKRIRLDRAYHYLKRFIQSQTKPRIYRNGAPRVRSFAMASTREVIAILAPKKLKSSRSQPIAPAFRRL